jgi:hypothetical protein
VTARWIFPRDRSQRPAERDLLGGRVADRQVGRLRSELVDDVVID